MSLLDNINKYLEGQDSRPPIHLWNPDLSGDIDIRIAANGEWFHEGDKINRNRLVKLFASILRREDDGNYYLVTPVEKWCIEVEDTALQIIDMEVLGEGLEQKILFLTNVESRYLLSEQYPLSIDLSVDTGEPKPTVSLENKLTAKLSRSVFYRLVDLAFLSVCEEQMYVVSDNTQFILGGVDG